VLLVILIITIYKSPITDKNMSQKTIKAGILIAALVVPALIFLYLKGFGENHYNLPY